MTDVAKIAAGLTEANRAFLLVLPADGSWRYTAHDIEAAGRNALRGFEQSGLIIGEYKDRTRHRLTDLGKQVRSHLLAGDKL
jgi:hypothetical protein